jgi:hypothetical protein
MLKSLVFLEAPKPPTEGLENIYALGRKTLLDGQQDIRFELA